ncbi:MAG: hypothetical protein IKM23_02675, partial [Bacteroidales bacterium]|nr:hypothetical protein [Bacteroidales bacterium]
MFVRKKKNRSGSTSVIVVEKNSNKYKEHITIGISSDENEIEGLVEQGKEWIREYQSRHSPELDLYGEETEAKIKNESKSIRQWILEQEKVDRQMHEYDKGNDGLKGYLTNTDLPTDKIYEA